MYLAIENVKKMIGFALIGKIYAKQKIYWDLK